MLSPTALVDCNVHCTETYDPGSSREGGAVQCSAVQCSAAASKMWDHWFAANDGQI